MANYNRNILVPYLQDLCSIELICSKLEHRISDAEKNVNRLTEICNRKVTDPVTIKKSLFIGDDWKQDIYICIPGAIIIAIAILVLATLGKYAGLFKVIGWLGILYGALFFVMAKSKAQEDYSNAEYRYKEYVAKHDAERKRNAEFRNALPARRAELDKARQELSALRTNYANATTLRNRTYDINIVPRQYRNIYAVYYLYDFFSTSRENDLEKVIQTFVLEEIKQKLDKIIRQNENILLNQRVQLALQEQQNRVISENHRNELKQLAKMERNQELQLDYQKMITANQEVTNFLLAADFYKKYC